MDRLKSSLQGKVLLIFLLIFVSIGLVDLIVQKYTLIPSFIKLENQAAVKNLERCRYTVELELSKLDMLCGDWAAWTDTYNYVQNPYAEYENSNLPDSTFTSYGIQLILFLNRSNEVVWGKIFDPGFEKIIALKTFPLKKFTQDHPALQFENEGDLHKMVKKGVLKTEHGPIMISSRPIIKSSNEGPIMGTFIMGKFLSETVVASLAQQINVPFEILTPENGSFTEIIDQINSNNKKDGYILESLENNLKIHDIYLDINANPAFIIKTQFPRENTDNGFAAVRFSLGIRITSSLVIISLLLYLLRQSILQPIIALTDFTADIRSNKNFNKRITMERSDEIGVLADGMNGMIDTIDEQTGLLMEANAQLKLYSSIDGLTGIPNRRTFDEEYAKYWNLHYREKNEFGLILCDIDHFKCYNDTYGHQEGDQCLKAVAQTIEQSLMRSTDLPARYGGEEFAVILPNTDHQGAEKIAETIREAVEGLGILHEKAKTSDRVTISLGVGAMVPPRDMLPAKFIKMVDKALYRAKEKGRNQVNLARS